MASPLDDHALLQEFIDHGSQPAFAQLVERYAGLVHSAALRQTRDRQLAEDVSQAVFLLLAQRARTIGPRVALSGWLYNTARYAGLVAKRGAERRRRHEQKAADQMIPRKQSSHASLEWNEIEPSIDAAMARLRAGDRVALVLRYFEDQSLKQVAAALNLSEDAAKRRCHRGLERLRKLLRVNTPASAIGAALSANAVQPAPAHLIAAVSNVPTAASPAAAILAKGALHMMIQAKLKLAAVVMTFLLAAGAAQIALTRAATPAKAPAPTAAANANAPKRTAADVMPSQVPAGSARAAFYQAFTAGIASDAIKLRSLVLLDKDDRAIIDRAASAQLAFEKTLKSAFPNADTKADDVLSAAAVRFIAVSMKGLNNFIEDAAGDECTLRKPGGFELYFRKVDNAWKWDLTHNPQREDDPQFRLATGQSRVRLIYIMPKLAATYDAAAKKLAVKGYASRGEALADVRGQFLKAMQETPPEFRPATQPVVRPIVPIQTEDYAAVRKSFRTNLVHNGPATAPSPIPPTPADAQLVEYPSGALHLKAWLSSAPSSGPAKHPAIIHLYSGFQLHPDKWANTQLFRDAGFVFMMPTLRSQHGQGGEWSAYYDEVDDVLAAAAYLRSLPTVDPERIFLVGYGDGAAVALLAAEAAPVFRAVAPISGFHDYLLLSKALSPAAFKRLPFDSSNQHEFEVRSGLAYLPSLKCPAQILYGKVEFYLAPTADRMVELATTHHLEVSATAIPGETKEAVQESLRQALAFFQKHL